MYWICVTNMKVQHFWWLSAQRKFLLQKWKERNFLGSKFLWNCGSCLGLVCNNLSMYYFGVLIVFVHQHYPSLYSVVWWKELKWKKVWVENDVSVRFEMYMPLVLVFRIVSERKLSVMLILCSNWNLMTLRLHHDKCSVLVVGVSEFLYLGENLLPPIFW